MSDAGSEPGPDEGASIGPLGDRLEHVGRIDHQIAGLPDVVPLLSQVIDPLSKRLDDLVESTATVREDLALVAEVLALLTQLAEVGDEHLGGLAAGQEAMLGQQRSLVTGAIGELSRSLTADVHELTSGLAELVVRTAVLDERIGNLSADGLDPVRTALDGLSLKIDALSEPDQGPVASQLARLSAIVASQARHEPATSGDVSALSRSLEDAMHLVTQQLERQADSTLEVWTYLAKQPTPAERTDDLHYVVGRATAGLQAALEQMSIEVAAMRGAIERRPSPHEAERSGPSELEQRVDLALAAMDQRLSSLTEVVERGATRADSAAKAATAALRLVRTSAPPTAPSVASARKAPVKKTAGSETVAEKRGARTAAAKKATTATKAPATRKAPGSTRRTS